MSVRAAGRFALHYLEMVLAMTVGMAAFYPGWLFATRDVAEGSVLQSTEVETLVMASTMVLPMAAWMWFRGHARGPVVEMSAAMYAGFVVLYPLLWAGVLDEMGLMMWGHVLMFVLMLAAMLWRWEEYAHGCHASTGPDRRRRTIDVTA